MIYHRHILYSLEALGYLASRPENRLTNVQELAEKLDIPRHFLGKVLTELVKKELVTSCKGPTGGFKLSVLPESISVYRILAILGGLSRLEDSCIMGLSECAEKSPCSLHSLWSEFKEKAISKTQKLTLAEFSQKLKNKLKINEENINQSEVTT